ncbi:hypothetical protein [Haloferula sp. BvORR071]|uniref:hypothetical protein n=1 Tax=Haloferula sp. BvORR071 TaxID=1396141 RepID=UPI0005586C30|nr:hypothetical protein [Haloferula sp. BvORR071]
MKLPLRHRPLFWIGLLPVLVLLCLWAASVYYRSSWYYSSHPDYEFSVKLSGSAIQFQRARIIERQPGVDLAALPLPIPTGPFGRWLYEDPAPPSTWFPLPHCYNRIAGDSPGSFFKAQIQGWRAPFWFLLALYLPLWLWLVRRQGKRIAKRLGEAESKIA